MNYNNYDHQAYIDSHKSSKFKVGDWVTTESGSLFQLLEQNPYSPNNFCVDLAAPSCYYYDIDVSTIECKLWQPAEGEWCWFLNPRSAIHPVLGKFITRNDEFFECSNGIAYGECEPFIGTLPSWCA